MAKTYSKKDIFEGSLFNDAIKEAQQMSAVLEGLDDKIVKLSNSYKNTLQNANVTNKKGIEDIIKVSSQLNDVTEQANKIEKDKLENTERLKKAELEQAKAYEQFTKEIQKRQTIEEKAHAKREQQYNKEIQQTEKIAQKEAERAAKLSGSYSKVQIKLNQLTNTYRDLAIKKELGLKLTDKEEKRYTSLQGRIQMYDKALKSTDASMGKYQRNVGNYASAYNGLNNSVSQLAREMPAFANSVGTGFMAISNNLPIFFDEIQKIKVANKELAASGEPTKSLFKQLAGSIFSVSTLLSVGVTLLTVYGAKVVEMLSGSQKTEEQLKKEAQAREELNKKKREGAEFVGRESAQMVGYLEALKATNKGSKERSEIISKLNDQYGTHLKNLQDESAFQAQVNDMVREYIQYQREAFKIKRNTDLIELNLTKQELIISKLVKSYGLYRNEIDKAISTGNIDELNSKIRGTGKLTEDLLRAQRESAKQSLADAPMRTAENEQLATQKTNLEELIEELKHANERLEYYGINIANAESGMGRWKRSTKKQIDSQKELNTELDKTEEYLTTQTELLDKLAGIRSNKAIDLVDQQMKDELALQIENIDKGNEYDYKELWNLLETKKQLRLAYLEDETKIEIDNVTEKYRLLNEEELKAIEENKSKLIAAGGDKIAIEASYQKELETYKENELQRAADLELEKQVIYENAGIKREEILKEEVNIEIDANKQIEEALAKHNEEIDKKRKEELAKEKEHAKEMMEVRKFYVNGIIDEMKRLSNIREAEYEKEANDQKTLQDKLQAQANAGNITAKESIAASIEAQKEATIAKQKEQRRQQRLEEMKILYNLIEAKIDKGDSAPKAIGKSLAEMALIKGAARLFDNVKGFYKGTKGKLKDEDTAIRGGKDGHLIWADGDEMIFNPNQTSKLESVGLGKTDDVVNSALMYKLNLGMVNLGAGKQNQTQSQTDLYLKKLVDVMESKGEFYLDPIVVNGIAKGVVSTEIKGNVTKYSEYRPKH